MWRLNCGYLKLDGTEDDDDDDDDEMTQNKLLILVAKDVKAGTYAATRLRETGVSEYATSWLVSLLRRLGYRRAILQSDGEPSIVTLKTATLLASPSVGLVLRERPVGEHVMNIVAESAMREVKRPTRTLNIALEAHVGKTVESHSILKWTPTMAADATSFFRIGKDGLTAEIRRSGRAWKKLFAELVKFVHYRQAAARAVASGMQPKARTGSIFIMTTEGVVKTAGVRRIGMSTIGMLRPQITHLPLTPRRRYVARADLRKYGVTIGCLACSDIAVHGRTSKLHTEDCRNWIGEQVQHDPEGRERLQVHKRRRDVEPEIGANRAKVARENDGNPALQERQDVEMPAEAPVESACVKRGSDAVADNEARARLRLRAEGKRGQKHDMQDVPEPQVQTRARLEPRRSQKRESTQPFLIWRKRSCGQFLLRVVLLRFREARARVLTFLSIHLRLRA